MLAKIAFGNVRKSLRDFGVYFLTVMLGVAVFYAFNAMTSQESVLTFSETQDRMFELLGMVIGGASVFIACVLAFLVMYANRFLITRRKKEFGLYLTLGMGAAQVRAIVVLEALIVGAASLAAGCALGVGLSQALLYVTSALFQADIASVGGFSFVLSPAALRTTVVLFAGIFLVAAAFNARTVSRARLIDLLSAERRCEAPVLRSLPAALAVFVVSVALIAASYHLLLENGLMELTPQFAAATVLVCVGTGLFFWSLSGFLLRAAQLSRPLYFRGLNMFALRQLNAKVNTTHLTLTVVCLTLFLAITSVCGGIGMRNTLEATLANSTAYSASVRTTFAQFNAEDGWQDENLGPFGDYAASIGFDMERGLRDSMAKVGADVSWDDLVSASAQVDFLVDPENPLTIADLETASGLNFAESSGNSAVNPGYGTMPVYLMAQSRYDAACALAGKPTAQLASGESLLLADSQITADWLRQVAAAHPDVQVGGEPLRIVGFSDACLETTSFPMNTGALVVPDDALPADARILYSTLNVQCVDTDTDTDTENAFATAVGAVAESTDPATWPITLAQTRESVVEQSIGLSSVISYLAIYLGFVLTIACASILAIQQLSEASDNARRYALLRKLGTPRAMIDRALLLQVGVYFVFPLVLACAHAACALSVVADVVAVFGALDIGSMALACAGAFIVVYGAYFLVTYFGARALAKG